MSVLDEIETFEVFFDTLLVGQTFRTPGRTVTEADIVNFAGLSGDYNAVHMDAAHAAGTIHGERIAHGLLVLAIASGLCTRLPLMRAMEKTLLGLANLQCRWLRPTKIGDTLHVVIEITETKASSKPDRGSVTMTRTAVNQRGESVMESEWALVLKRSGEATKPIQETP
jgi:acyl dehydratase